MQGTHECMDVGILVCGEIGRFRAGDQLQLRVNTENRVEYVRNGRVLHTSVKTVTYPLTVKLLLYEEEASVSDVKMITREGFDEESTTALCKDDEVVVGGGCQVTTEPYTFTESRSNAPRVRLTKYPRGQLEVLHESANDEGQLAWRPVCRKNFVDNDNGAIEACRELGYASGKVCMPVFVHSN